MSTAQPSTGGKRAALEAVLASETFARSEQLRGFLRHVCEMEAEGRGAELTEYNIGVHALGRPAGYSPLEDSSVRTRAYELRQRLNRYYTGEAPEAPLRIVLPKGSYVPRYLAAEVEARIPERPEGAPVAPPHRPWRAAAAGFLLGLVAAATGWAVFGARTERAGPDPAVRQAWTPVATTDAEVLVCMGTPLHLLVSPYMERVPDTQPKYPAPPEAYGLFGRFRSLPRQARLEMQPTQNAVPMGNVQALARVTAVLGELRASYRILPETNAPLAAMRRRSAVLLASPWYSRSAEILLERTPWTTQPDPQTGDVGIVGRGPAAGRNFFPKRGPHGEYQDVYGLVTVMLADEAGSDGRTTVVLTGLTSAGTHGAAAFLTNAGDLRGLGQRFRKEGLEGWPRAYQVVVRCRASEDTQMLSYAYEAHQVMGR